MIKKWPLFEHQEHTAQFILDSDPGCFIMNDPGTGKTRSVLEAFDRHKKSEPKAKLIVIAPLSILEPAWGADIKKFTPHLKYVVAYASNRQTAFNADVDIYITNHDAVKWLKTDGNYTKYTQKRDWLVVDESTAFKNATTQRSKALQKISGAYSKRILMTGTPVPNTICDVWHQILCVDGGQRLGSSFYRFRSQVCNPVPVFGMPNIAKWEDKPGATDWVMDMIRDISIRYAAEDCLDLPENRVQTLYIDLPRAIRNKYDQLAIDSVVLLQDKVINAVHAGSRLKKLLQLCTGAVYDNDGKAKLAHTARYELVADLVEQRPHPCVVAYNWKHERQQLQELADKRGISMAFIDGEVNPRHRTRIVDEFQAGKIKMLACHPQAAGHGLTLTAGKTTIWCSPTYNSEHFQQLNRRVHRAGQTEKTETILIAANHTAENEVYEKLQNKLVRMDDLLSLFADNTQQEATA